MAFESFDRVWFLTWTTYGTWLPGDERGFVSPKFDMETTQRRNNLVGSPCDAARPKLERMARANLKGDPIWLTKEHAEIVQAQFEETARYRGWTIVAGAVMSNHVHLLIGTPGDPEPASLMRDLKSYASRALNRSFGMPAGGTWWTEQGSKRKVTDATHFAAVRGYIARQKKILAWWESGGDEKTGG